MSRAALLLLVLGVVAAGCGSGPKSPSVASLAASGTTTSSSQSSPPSVGTASGGGNTQFQMKIQGGAKFAQCMRANGVPSFPDPSSQGVISASGSSLNPASPAFRKAQLACRKDLPNGGQPSPQQIAKAKAAALAFSRCMRAHGLKDFPDPMFGSGGGTIRLSINSGKGGDLNPNDPTFRKAQAACGGLIGKR